MKSGLVIVDTHPVQYRAPLYRMLQQEFKIPVTVIYGSDFSISGYRDKEFKSRFSWDVNLLGGYQSIFLSEIKNGGARCFDAVTGDGVESALDKIPDAPILVTGYQHRLYRKALSYSFKKKRTVLLRAETTDHAKRRFFVQNWIRDQLLKQIYSRLAFCLYVGKRSREHFLRLGVPEKNLIFSPYCVDEQVVPQQETKETLREKMRSRLNATENDIVILFSGKLVYRKGVDLLLQAIKQFPDQTRNRIQLLFLGDGDLRLALETEANRNPKIRTYFAGFQNQSQITAYYFAADLLVLPSRYSETWGLVVNEALHHGIPCVVSEAVGCAPDLIESGVTGERFETGSAAGLAQAILRALELIQKPGTAEQCRLRADQYSMSRAAEGIARVYQEVVS